MAEELVVGSAKVRRQAERLYKKFFVGVQVNVLDLGNVLRDLERAVVAKDDDAKLQRIVERWRAKT